MAQKSQELGYKNHNILYSDTNRSRFKQYTHMYVDFYLKSLVCKKKEYED